MQIIQRQNVIYDGRINNQQAPADKPEKFRRRSTQIVFDKNLRKSASGEIAVRFSSGK